MHFRIFVFCAEECGPLPRPRYGGISCECQSAALFVSSGKALIPGLCSVIL